MFCHWSACCGGSAAYLLHVHAAVEPAGHPDWCQGEAGAVGEHLQHITRQQLSLAHVLKMQGYPKHKLLLGNISEAG